MQWCMNALIWAHSALIMRAFDISHDREVRTNLSTYLCITEEAGPMSFYSTLATSSSRPLDLIAQRALLVAFAFALSALGVLLVFVGLLPFFSQPGHEGICPLAPHVNPPCDVVWSRLQGCPRSCSPPDPSRRRSTCPPHPSHPYPPPPHRTRPHCRCPHSPHPRVLRHRFVHPLAQPEATPRLTLGQPPPLEKPCAPVESCPPMPPLCSRSA